MESREPERAVKRFEADTYEEMKDLFSNSELKKLQERKILFLSKEEGEEIETVSFLEEKTL